MGDMQGHCYCFMCGIKLELGEELEGSSSSHSIDNLARFLEVDLEELSKEGSLEREEGREHKLEVSLCEDCGGLNQDFVEVYQRQLELDNGGDQNQEDAEEIDLELGYCIKLIFGKMTRVKAEDSDLEEDGMVTGLKSQLIAKCSKKLGSILAADVPVEDSPVEEPGGTIKGECPDVKDQITVEGDLDDRDPDSDWTPSSSGSEDEYLVEEDENSSNNDPAPTDSTKSLVLIYSSDPEASHLPRNPKGMIDPLTRKYSCNLCPRTFKSIVSWKDHYDSSHLQVMYQCGETGCGKQFRQKRSFLRHHQSVHGGAHFRCSICSKRFIQKWYLKQHYQADHLGDRLKCQYCSESFAYSASLNRHMRSRCSMRGVEQEPMKKSPSRLKGRFGLKCQYCSESFAHLASLNRHMRSRCSMRGVGQEPKKKSPSRLKKQRKPPAPGSSVSVDLKTEPEPEPCPAIKCEEPDPLDMDNFILPDDDHKVPTSQPPPLQSTTTTTARQSRPCPICKKTFMTSMARRIHGKACRQRLQQQGGLTALLSRLPRGKTTPSGTEADVHPDPLKIISDPVDPTSSAPPVGSKHSKTDKSQCSLCPKLFCSKHDLQRHVKRVHVKDTQFKCTECGKTFNQINGYNRHYQTVHSGLMFQCELCNRRIADSSNFRKHQKLCQKRTRDLFT